jgi:ceramide glucosyltransferase
MSVRGLLRGLLVAASVASAGYQVAALVAAHRYRRRAYPPLSDAEAPPVTLLKPVKGADPEAAESFRTFCRQDYPEYEVLFGALDLADPALATARRVVMEPGAAYTLLLGSPREHGTNPKVSNLLNLYPLARRDLLVISDSDLRVRPDFLRRVLAPFRDPEVGLVTCPYRAVRSRGLAAPLEALSILTEFIPSVLVAERLGGMHFALGAVMAVRREALEAIGGLEAIADLLADDYELGRRVRDAGWEVSLCPPVVDIVLARESFAASWARRLRWMRTVRVCRPAGYLGSGITHTTPIALLALLLSRRFPIGQATAASALLTRLAAAAVAARALDTPLPLARSLLLPASDVLSFALWCAGLLGRRVRWRGQQYRLWPDGRITPIPSPPKKARKS